MTLPCPFPLVLPCDSVCPLPPPCLFIFLPIVQYPSFPWPPFCFLCHFKHLPLPVSPYRYPSLSLPLLSSPPTSVSSVSWLLWWGTEFLFLVRNLHGGFMPCHHLCPLYLFSFSNFFLYLSRSSFFSSLPSHLLIYILIGVVSHIYAILPRSYSLFPPYWIWF